MKKQIDVNAQTVTFTFEDGLEPVRLNVAATSAECRTYAMLHGFSARIGDNAALARKQPDGTVVAITEAMRRAEVAKLVEHYASGATEWNLKAQSAQNPVIAAIAVKRGCTYAEAEALLAAQFLAE